MTDAEENDYQRLSFLADLADAVDPTLTESAQNAALDRIARAEPQAGLALLAGFTRGLIGGMGEGHPDGVAGVMRTVRDHFSRTLRDE